MHRKRNVVGNRRRPGLPTLVVQVVLSWINPAGTVIPWAKHL